MYIAANMLNAAATGDEANIALYVVLIVIAVALVVFLGCKDKIIKPKDDPKKDGEKTAASGAKKEDARKAAEEKGKEPDIGQK